MAGAASTERALLLAVEGSEARSTGGVKRRRRSAFVSTNTLENPIAAAAKTGESNTPKTG